MRPRASQCSMRRTSPWAEPGTWAAASMPELSGPRRLDPRSLARVNDDGAPARAPRLSQMRAPPYGVSRRGGGDSPVRSVDGRRRRRSGRDGLLPPRDGGLRPRPRAGSRGRPRPERGARGRSCRPLGRGPVVSKMNAVTSPRMRAGTAASHGSKLFTKPRMPIESLQSLEAALLPAALGLHRHQDPADDDRCRNPAEEEDARRDSRYPPLRPAAEELREPQGETGACDQPHRDPEVGRARRPARRSPPQARPRRSRPPCPGKREQATRDAARVAVTIGRTLVHDLALALPAVVPCSRSSRAAVVLDRPLVTLLTIEQRHSSSPRSGWFPSVFPPSRVAWLTPL